MRKFYLIWIAMLFSFISCINRPLSRGELKSYIHNEENGLLKKANNTEADIEILYWPRQFILSTDIDYNDQDLDSIDYFLVKLSSKHAENNYTDLTQHVLMIESDTIEAMDAVSFNDPVSTKRSITTLLAYKSFLQNRSVSSVSLLFSNKPNGRVDFSIEDIKKVNEFLLIENR